MRQANELPHGSWVFDARFSPDGGQLVTACRDRSVRVWNSTNGELAPLLRHPTAVSSARFSPDGLRVLTRNSDLAEQQAQATAAIQRQDRIEELLQAAHEKHSGSDFEGALETIEQILQLEVQELRLANLCVSFESRPGLQPVFE